MPPKTISQTKWVKCLVASVTDTSQPKGSLSRLSNLLFTRRGGLKTCDGSLIISALNGSLALGSGPWTEVTLFQPVNVSRYYVGLRKDLTSQLSSPTGLAVADGGAGGTLANATYRYVVTANDGAGGETTISNEFVFANPGAHKANLTWNSVTNAVNYNVYRTAPGGAAGTEVFITSVATTAFIDDNSITPGTATPPVVNSTQQCVLFHIPANSYGAGNILAVFPADAFLAVDGTPGGTGGGGGSGPGGGPGSTPSSGNPPTPQGGNTGNLSPLPQFAQFVGKLFMALGNGFAPQILTDPSTVAPITNTFTATYPDWQTATLYSIGDIIKPSANNAGNFVFKVLQGGTSGGAAPTFPQTANQQVNDNQIIWQNIGLGNTAPAPRGAAHAVVYAGSLWVLNTNPTTTSDNLDGPNCLKMSDLNNPTSWNPLNVAFLSKDDGDQGTGLLSFTIADVGIASTSALFAFKNFKTFQIIGVFGATDFQILEVQTDMGCIAPRSISFAPGFGGVRLTHLGVAVLDGIRDKLISEDIRPYLFSETNTPDIVPMDWNYAYLSKGAQTANPPMYVLAIPLALQNIVLGSFGNEVNFTTVAGASTWTTAPQFFRVAKVIRQPDGTLFESALTLEKVINVPAGNNTQVVVQISAPDPDAVFYSIYWGAIAGTYTQFIRPTPAQMVAGFVLSGPTSLTTQGSLLNGVGGLTRLLCYDLVFKGWTIIDLPFAISVLKQVRAPGTQPITVIGGFSDAAIRRIQAGDTTFDGAAVAWKMKTAKVFADGETRRVFYRSLQMRGFGSATGIIIVPNYNSSSGVAGPPVIYTLGSNGFHLTSDLLTTALDADASISGTGPVEIDSVDWEVEPEEAGVPLVMG